MFCAYVITGTQLQEICITGLSRHSNGDDVLCCGHPVESVCVHARYELLTQKCYTRIIEKLTMTSNSSVNVRACYNQRLCFNCCLQRQRLCNEALIMQNGSEYLFLWTWPLFKRDSIYSSFNLHLHCAAASRLKLKL